MKNFCILEDERPSKSFTNLENGKRGYSEAILTKKENIDYNPNLPESDENSKYTEVTDRQGINEKLHKAFQKNYAKQKINDSSEAVQDFLGIGKDTMPSEQLTIRTLTDEERDKIDGEIMLDEMQEIGKAQAHQA